MNCRKQTMNMIIKSRILGLFEGWYPDGIYMLQDGTNWQQISPVVKARWLQNPYASVVQSGSRYFLKVKGMGPGQEVRPLNYGQAGYGLEGFSPKEQALVHQIVRALEVAHTAASRSGRHR